MKILAVEEADQEFRAPVLRLPGTYGTQADGLGVDRFGSSHQLEKLLVVGAKHSQGRNSL